MKRMIRQVFLVGFILFSASQAWAQNRVVYGKLTAFNKYPLQNIEVVAKKSKSIVKTDSTGGFSIVCKEKDMIKINPKAFKPTTRKINKRTDTLYINLVFIDNQENREIATGYEYINAQDLNYAVSHLAMENNEFCNYNNIFELIEGKFPGVRVDDSQYGGAVYVRGSASVSLDTEALYVLDGSIVSSIEWIHPCDVQSINILKDGMAAMYGARGANGVVVIELKKGGR